ncbi:MAG: hypothetical protein A2148_08485 [Chloroflexi bacterium RBG_16_68_14]|nr:MAG: hypothetical protein A2148_08485 [Chloroflexi bacterium RBG_16_68_14]
MKMVMNEVDEARRQYLAQALQESGVKPIALARQAGVTKQWLSDALAGNRAISENRLESLLRAIEALAERGGAN